MQKIKMGNQLYGVQPEMVLCHSVVASVFAYYAVDCVMTSVVGRKHGERSLHPPGYAIDYRSKHIHSELKQSILNTLRDSLPQCDVLLESLGEPQEHYHIEFDPQDDIKWMKDKAEYKKSGVWP